MCLLIVIPKFTSIYIIPIWGVHRRDKLQIPAVIVGRIRRAIPLYEKPSDDLKRAKFLSFYEWPSRKTADYNDKLKLL